MKLIQFFWASQTPNPKEKDGSKTEMLSSHPLLYSNWNQF